MAARQDALNGTFKIDQCGQILWADDNAKHQLRIEHDATQLERLITLEGGKPLLDYIQAVIEAASYGTRGSWAIIHPQHNPAASLQLSAWVDSDNKELLICHLNPTLCPSKDNVTSSTDMLTIITDLQQDYIADKGSFYVFGRALDALLTLTNSRYGFIGEILQDAHGNNLLKTHAITNIAWNADTRNFYEQNAPVGMEFTNHNTLFGHTVTTGQAVISNNPATDPKRGGLPAGHPSLDHYMGIPIMAGEEFIGMAGIANRPSGYDESFVQNLTPLLNTLGILLGAFRTEQKRRYTEAQLRSKAHELEQANRAKTRFFAAMSHELRTPLNSVLGFSRRLQKTLADTLTQRNQYAFDAVIRNAEHLTHLIDDILDISKIEAGKLELNLRTLHAQSIINQALYAILGMAEQQRVLITDKTAEHLKGIKIDGDEQRLLQIILNLLSNAIKYGEGANVEIYLTRISEEEIAFVVEDFGPGIVDDARKSLFQEYSRLASAERKHIQGTGLGLSLVAELTQLHGGRNWVETELGQGSRFYASLPISGH